ncbi:hypothetical protein MOSL_1935 [Moraxella osloensis]|nr:hypothetical protein MOSL_1935 [Moraxella osloensis]
MGYLLFYYSLVLANAGVSKIPSINFNNAFKIFGQIKYLP